METFNDSNEEKRAQECVNRGNFWVCKECADKYSKNLSYEGILTMHNDECYICQQHRMVAPSYKLFGFYKGVI